MHQVFLLGNIKALLTFVKYAPQAWLNFQRKSTHGLSMLQFTLDVTGGILSLAQLFLDSAGNGNLSAAFSNPAKLMLGNITILFDVLFFCQHYIIYRNKESSHKARETDPLLPARGPITAT